MSNKKQTQNVNSCTKFEALFLPKFSRCLCITVAMTNLSRNRKIVDNTKQARVNCYSRRYFTAAPIIYMTGSGMLTSRANERAKQRDHRRSVNAPCD